jgi:predicted phosphodiesterase
MPDYCDQATLDNNLSDADQYRLVQAWRDGKSVRGICRDYLPEIPFGTAMRWVRSLILYNGEGDAPNVSEPDIARSNVPFADQIPQLKGDMLIMSDLHIPYHDADLIEEAMDRAKSIGIKQWLIVGDMMDGNQWSKRGLNMTYQRRWQDDADVAKAIIDHLVEYLGPGTVLMGNHDAWFVKHFRGQADTEWLLSRLFSTDENVLWSTFEQATIKSGDREIRATHGANYSGANPLGIGQRLAAKWECSVVMGHQHHATHGLSWSGKHQVICMGGMHDPRKLAYLHEAPRTNPAQTRSYVILKSGKMEHIFAY